MGIKQVEKSALYGGHILVFQPPGKGLQKLASEPARKYKKTDLWSVRQR